MDTPVLALQVKCTIPMVREGLFYVTEATSLLVSGGCLPPAWEHFFGRVIAYYLGTPAPAQGVPAPPPFMPKTTWENGWSRSITDGNPEAQSEEAT